MAVASAPLAAVRHELGREPLAAPTERAPEPRRSELATSMGALLDSRPIEGRLAGLGWSPYREAALHPIPAESLVVGARLISTLGDRVGSSESGNALADLAVVQLHLGNLAGAVRNLEAAAALAPDDPHHLIDLAAAGLALADAEPWRVFQGYALAARAAERDPHLLEARFNTALAIERMGLVDRARQAWEGYLELDPASEYATEARARLARLQRPSPAQRWATARAELEAAGSDLAERASLLASEFPAETRLYVDRDLLPQWAERRANPQVEEPLLERAHALVTALRARGNALPLRQIELIRGARQSGDTETLRQLARGHLLHRQALDLIYQEWQPELAKQTFREAEALFAQAGSPYAFWSRLYQALCHRYLDSYDEASRMLDRLLADIEGHGFLALEARTRWIQGLTRSALGDLDGSLSCYLAAARRFEELGERRHVASMDASAAAILDSLERPSEAWRHALAALRGLGWIDDPTRRQALVDSVSQLAQNRGDLRSALLLLDTLVDITAEAGQPYLHYNALAHRATVLGQLGRDAAAALDLDLARREAARIADRVLAERAEADLRLIEGELLVDRDPERAAGLLVESIAHYQATEFTYLRSRAHVASARALLAIGRVEEAERALIANLEHHLEIGGRLRTRSLYRSYSTQTASAFDEMIGFLAHTRGSPAAAHAFAERSKAVLHRLGSGGDDAGGGSSARDAGPTGVSVAGPTTARSALPERTLLVEYAVLADEILIWALTSDGLASRRVDLGRERLATTIRTFTESCLLRTDPGCDALSAALYATLIGPLDEWLAGRDTLVVVPDKEIWAVPFPALRPSRHDLYLLERLAVIHSPSAELFLRARDESLAPLPPRASEALRAVVVGNPLHRSTGLDLRDLPGAEAEARAVATRYPGARLLLGEAADRSAVVRALAAAEVFHFAGHAIADPAREDTLLLLAGADLETGALSGSDVDELDLAALRLAVLSACGTGAPRLGADGPAAAAALPWLRRGVPGVVASLAAVEDEATRRVLNAFHEGFEAGLPAHEALRRAQLATLRAATGGARAGVSAWATFLYLGADGVRLTGESARDR
jgi:CHAT domain-containing protein